MKGKLPIVRVGIIGNKPRKGGTKLTNADIGARHEFGADGMPVRSFLRVPVAEHLQQYLDEAGAFDERALAEAVKTGGLLLFMKKVGVVAEAIIADGFDSGGFGKWKPSNMAHKKVQMTLVETQQLRNSITSEVK